MKMKESIRSLRGYFYFVAIVSGLVNALMLINGGAANPISLISSLVGLGLAAAFLYVAIAFRTLIYDAPGQIKGVIFTSIGFLVANFALPFLLGSGMMVNPVGMVIGLGIDFYLLANVQRIATEGEGE